MHNNIDARPAIVERSAHIASDCASEKDKILDIKRLVEPKIAPHRFTFLRPRVLWEHEINGIPWSQPSQEKDDQGYPNEHENCLRESLNQIASQGPLSN